MTAVLMDSFDRRQCGAERAPMHGSPCPACQDAGTYLHAPGASREEDAGSRTMMWHTPCGNPHWWLNMVKGEAHCMRRGWWAQKPWYKLQRPGGCSRTYDWGASCMSGQRKRGVASPRAAQGTPPLIAQLLHILWKAAALQCLQNLALAVAP